MTGIGGFGGDRDQPVEGAEGEGKLAFDSDGESLPWLESGDDDDGDEGADSSRIIAFIVGGLLLLGVLVGLVWWLSHRGSDSEMVADGSMIEAPDKPYKAKPAQPGGKTFEGTGDSSFAVGEGQTREGRIAAGDDAVRPSINAAPPAPAPSAPAPSAPATAASSGTGVQVGAFSTRESAEAGWSKLATRHEALKGVSYRIVEGKADIGTVYRLQAVAGDEAAAERLCSALKAQGAACQVKR